LSKYYLASISYAGVRGFYRSIWFRTPSFESSTYA